MSTIEKRQVALGGSEIPVALGLSRHKTILALWAEKVGSIEPEDVSDKMAVKLGIRLEPIVADLFTEETGKVVHRVNEGFTHPKYPFLVGHIDRRVVGESSIVEIKTTSAYREKEWLDEQAPPEAVVQTLYYMGLAKANKAFPVGLIGNTKLIIRELKHDPIVYAEIVKKAVDFWGVCRRKEMPAVITSRDSDTLYKLFPLAEPGSEIDLGDAGTRLVELRQSMIADKIALEDQIDKRENEIRAMMKENEFARAGKYKISWKNQSATRLDTPKFKEECPELYERYSKQTASRVLRIKETSNNHEDLK